MYLGPQLLTPFHPWSHHHVKKCYDVYYNEMCQSMFSLHPKLENQSQKSNRRIHQQTNGSSEWMGMEVLKSKSQYIELHRHICIAFGCVWNSSNQGFYMVLQSVASEKS